MIFQGFDVRVTVRRNSKRMRITHRKGESFFSVSVPVRTTKRELEQFLKMELAWMQAHIVQEDTEWQSEYKAGEVHYLFGQQAILGQGQIPSGEDFVRWRNQLLMEHLRQLVPRWTERMGVSVSKITVRTMRSRWGSCSSNHHISINARLALYPPQCLEQVLIHELCHLFHPNHSAAFYQEMTRWMPDWKQWKQLLDSMNVKPGRGTSE